MCVEEICGYSWHWSLHPMVIITIFIIQTSYLKHFGWVFLSEQRRIWMVQVLAQNLVDPYPMKSTEGERCSSA